MDKKYSDPSMLHVNLFRFIGGQMQLQTRNMEFFRGEIYWIYFDRRSNTFSIYFKWFSPVRSVFDQESFLRLKADKGFLKLGYRLDFKLNEFYFPKSAYFRNGDSRRIKIFTNSSEILRCFLPDDITNLVEDEFGQLVSKCVLDQDRFRKGIPERIQPPPS